MPRTGTPPRNCSPGTPTVRTSLRSWVTRPTGTRPPAPAWKHRGSPSPPSARLPATPQGGSPRTGSPWSWPREPSPARPGKPPPSCRPPAAAGHRSGPGAPPARCGQSAPHRGAGAPSPSTRTKRCCSAPALPRKTRPGSSATGRTGPSSSARSLTSPAGPGVGGGPAPVDWPASPLTLSPAPEPSTGPGLRSLGSTTTKVGGRYGSPDHPAQRRPSQPIPWTGPIPPDDHPAHATSPPSHPKSGHRRAPGNPYFSAVLAQHQHRVAGEPVLDVVVVPDDVRQGSPGVGARRGHGGVDARVAVGQRLGDPAPAP